MKILVIGGNGLLGTFTVREAMRHGHQITILSRSQNLRIAESENEISRITGDIYAMTTTDIERVMASQDAVVYSLGLDDREVHRRPAFGLFHKDHVMICMRVVEAAKRSGVKKFIVFGSYFTHFEKVYPELNLSKHNVYIRSRLEQKEALLASSTKEFQTFLFELPYIIGNLPGSFPPWTFLFSMLRNGKHRVFFFGRGGTSVVTGTQVGQAVLGALESAVGGKSYPVSGGNLAWKDFARIYFEVTGHRKVILGIPKFVFKIFGFVDSILLFLRNQERGLSLANYAELQYREAFIEPRVTMDALKIRPEDCEEELKKMITDWVAFQKKTATSSA